LNFQKVFSYASYFSVSNFGDRSSGKQFEIPESQRHDANIGRALSEVGIDPLYSVFFDLLPKRPRHSVSDKPSPCDWWLCFSAHLGKFCDFPNRWKSLIQQVLSKNPSLLMYVAQQVMVMLLDEKYGFDFDETYPSRPFWFFIYGLLLLDEHELAGLTPAADGAASCLSLAASTRSSGDIPAGVKRLHTLLHRRYLAGRKRRLSPDVSVDYRAVSKRRWSEFKPWYQERQRQLLQLT
uniref:Ras-GEF domain-containing protein n=1 Tax=Macrostomum lignano TaxID=282301 RepID=A0A1I8H763_9PLAT